MKKALALVVGIVFLVAASGILKAVLADVQTVPSTSTFQIKVYPDNETMRSVRDSIGRSGVQWNPESAIRLDFNDQIVSDDYTLQQLLDQDVKNGKKPLFFVDKKSDKNVPGVFRTKTR